MCFHFLYLFWDSPFSLINDLLLLKFQEAREVLFHDGGFYHIETIPLICKSNQLTGFYMIGLKVVLLKILIHIPRNINSSCNYIEEFNYKGCIILVTWSISSIIYLACTHRFPKKPYISYPLIRTCTYMHHR